MVKRRRVGLHAVLLICGLALTLGLPVVVRSSWHGGEQFHTLIDLVSAIVAIAFGVFALSRYLIVGERLPLLVGLSFLAAGVADLLHDLLPLAMLLSSGRSPERFVPATWLSSRLVLGALLLAGIGVSKVAPQSRNPRQDLLWALALVAGVVGGTTAASWVQPPQLIFATSYFPRPWEWLPALFMAAALPFYLALYHQRQGVLWGSLTLSLVLGMGAQVYMVFSSSLYDACFTAAHLLQMGSYLVPAIGQHLDIVALLRQHVLVVEQLQRANAENVRLFHEAKELEQRYRDLYDNAPDMYLVVDPQRRIRDGNAALFQTLGYEREEVVGKPVFKFLTEESRRVAARAWAARLRSEPVEQMELQVLCKDGARLEVAASGRSILDAEGGLVEVRLLLRDITERRRTEEALRKSEATNRALLNAIPDLMFRISKDGTYLDFKSATEEGLLRPPSEFLGKQMHEVTPREVAQQAMRHIAQALQTGDMQVFEYRLLLNGAMRDYEARIVVSGEEEVLAIVRDITERKRLEVELRDATQQLQQRHEELVAAYRQLEELAIRDGLTGLFNHRYMQERLANEFAEARRYGYPLCCLMLDIDNFKSINDRYLHQFGDFVLQEVANLLHEQMRSSDVVARYGGEEVFIILPHIGLEEAQAAAHRLCQRIEQHTFQNGEVRVHLTVSIGVAALSDAGITSKDDLIRHADQALYAAKVGGRNKVVTWAELRQPPLTTPLERQPSPTGLPSRETPPPASPRRGSS